MCYQAAYAAGSSSWHRFIPQRLANTTAIMRLLQRHDHANTAVGLWHTRLIQNSFMTVITSLVGS